LLTKEFDSGTLMIAFEPNLYLGIKGIKKNRKHPNSGSLFNSEMEFELKSTRNDLESAFEELETANQDLQSTNEELQSTNEELETSREELQSLNEELITVNAELSDKIDQLSQSNNDLNNLLRSIAVATLYLDRELKIKRYTPAATKIFNLIPTDIERPITQLSSKLRYDSLAEDVAHTLKTLESKSIEVNDSGGIWYDMRIIPYRTAENVIEGALITFIDITNQKTIENLLEKYNEQFKQIMNNLPVIVYVGHNYPDLNFKFVGENSESITGFAPNKFVDNARFWLNRIHRDDKKWLVNSLSPKFNSPDPDVPFRWKCADGQYKFFRNYLKHVAGDNEISSYFVCLWQETTG